MPVLIGTFERVAFLVTPPSHAAWVDQRYIDHPYLTLLHLLPGLVLFLFGPLQFSMVLRRKALWLHRLIGRTFVVSAVLCGIGVCWMVIAFPALGGLLTQAVTFVLVAVMIVFMGLSIHAIRARKLVRHQAFMMRAYAIALSVTTARIFIDAAKWLFDLPFETTFVIASSLGVILNCTFVEMLIYPRARR
ncbi:DUF2306 domain-containing protein [Pseudosulfitobacter sp. SM2401]|uniref:DUF2306 domain-containing protein n=1 Tax=Pseudosulfitobacter sp. SM2401 TaxID=3350098 RepID=UPI0036F396B8